MFELCLHCESAPRANFLRLCDACAAVRGIRKLYRKNRNWTPARDARVQALVERAKRREPLFEEPQSKEAAA
jgi:hypothetical protein